MKNKLIIETLPDIDQDSLNLYYIKQPENLRCPIYDTIMLYDGGKIINPIPDEYGKSCFLLKYKNISYNKIGLLKLKAWYKHNYQIQVSTIDSALIIKWCIANKFEKHEGLDTICKAVR